MEGSPIFHHLEAMNISIDLQLAQQIQEVVSHPQLLNREGPLDELCIWAISWLVGNRKRLLAVDNKTIVGSGLSLERFLMRIPTEKRSDFIQCICELSQHESFSSPQLTTKCNNLRQTFQMSVQCRKLFQRLLGPVLLNPELVEFHFKTVWLAYVQIKATINFYSSTQQHALLLLCLARAFLGDYLHDLDPSDVANQVFQCFGEHYYEPEPHIQWAKTRLNSVLQKVVPHKGSLLTKEVLRAQMIESLAMNRIVWALYKLVYQEQENKGDGFINESALADMKQPIAPAVVPPSIITQPVVGEELIVPLVFSDEEEVSNDENDMATDKFSG